MELSKHFEHKAVEEKWYAHWEESGYFKSTPDERESYSVVIPPPNVTGVLHMGHVLNVTIQDVLVRKARLDGKNACWVPGTDHASIATEAKVVRMLREKGIKKSDLTRDEYMKYAWEWKEKYGGIILHQLKRLGASCDWDRTSFTMDEIRSEGVIKVFIDLYKKGKLYRDYRMVNWDVEAQTVLSNEEVLYEDEQSHLYYVKYQIEDSDEYVTVATKRPETIMGDTAIAINPKDERFIHLKGKRAIVPLVNRSVPIISDEYVDVEFGTGCLKVTPAHDINDYEIGKRHGLEIIDTINDDGTLSDAAQIHIGVERFAARKLVVKDLETSGNLVKIEDYTSSIGRSERTKTVVEPKMSLQWYVDMKSFAQDALKTVDSGATKFFPPKYVNTYNHWMNGIRDWCISRQLWWGHRIPAWYYKDEVFVGETVEDALVLANAHFPGERITVEMLKQDEDVLDTWFSSWLWPITVFDGFNDPETLKYYYPTQVLVTGWDIIFLWVARMIMAGAEWQNQEPFKHVYFTGMVRDKQRRKMSKSLGNSPDALGLLDQYGADAVRFGMLSCSPAGGDLLFDEKLCENGRNFSNKIWNALKLIKSFNVDDNKTPNTVDQLACDWFQAKIQESRSIITKEFETYRLSEALMHLYSFIWNDFCSWYLEMIKPKFGESINGETFQNTIGYFEELMHLLHPFMPFISEEVWSSLRVRENGDDCIMSSMAPVEISESNLISDIESLKDTISSIRDIRKKNNLKIKDDIQLSVESSPSAISLYERSGSKELVMKMGMLSSFEMVNEISGKSVNEISFLSGKEKYQATLNIEIDAEAEKVRIEEELNYAIGFVQSVEKKLSNERFVNNAPSAVVDMERKKLADGQEKIRILQESLTSLA